MTAAEPSIGSSKIRLISGRSAALLLVALILFLTPLLSPGTFFLHVATLCFINGILVLSLTVLARIRQLSVCPAAFAGIGAYTSALLATGTAVPFIIGAGLGIALCVMVAAILGWLILKLRGVYFVLTTFTFGQIITLLILDLDGTTGGAVGIGGIPAPSLFGVVADEKVEYYYLALTSLCVVFLFVEWLDASPLGRVFRAIYLNPRLSESCGIPTRLAQTIAFVISCALAGVGGILLAHNFRFIAPQNFDFWLSVTLVVMLVVGGRTSAIGAILGAIILTTLPEFLRSAAELQHILYGLIVLIVLRTLPNGLASLVRFMPKTSERVSR